MYFPLGWPKELLCGVSKKGQNERASSMSPEEMKCIVPNRYHMLFALLGKCSISIWHSKFERDRKINSKNPISEDYLYESFKL